MVKPLREGFPVFVGKFFEFFLIWTWMDGLGLGWVIESLPRKTRYAAVFSQLLWWRRLPWKQFVESSRNCKWLVIGIVFVATLVTGYGLEGTTKIQINIYNNGDVQPICSQRNIYKMVKMVKWISLPGIGRHDIHLICNLKVTNLHQPSTTNPPTSKPPVKP